VGQTRALRVEEEERAMQLFRSPSSLLLFFALIVSFFTACPTARAQSSLVDTIDYFDDFAVTGAPGSPAGPGNPRPNGFFGNNSNGAYNVKTNNLGITAIYRPAGRGDSYDVFSFNTPATGNDPRPANATGNPGGADGFAQSGGNDNVINYSARDRYVVALDAILPNDRLDISSGTNEQGGIFTVASLSVFFRKANANIPGGTSIDIFTHDPLAPNGVVQNPAPVGHTVSDDNWHHYALDFDRANNRLGIYVDHVLLNDLDLTTFANGVYANFSNATVGFGGSGGGVGFESYVDNFTVGTPVIPEPAGLGVIGVAAAVAIRRRRR
jgi:MYXO-CTERM domain-containing protein